jgi:hypothetical protein
VLKLPEGYYRPEDSIGELLIALLVFSSTCLFLYLFRDYTNLDGDEGIVLQCAQRILNGQVPYRDFFSFYTPGSCYSIALLFKLFGDNILVARTELVLCGGLFSVFTYLLARRVSSRWSALSATFIASLTCLPARFMVTHWDSTALAYVGLYCAVLWTESRRRLWAFAAGLCASLTCLFQQYTGFGLLLGLVVGGLIIARRTRTSNSHSTQTAFAALCGLLWPFVLIFGYFVTAHGARDMVRDWLWPLFHYSATNKTSYGYSPVGLAAIELWSAGWSARLVLFITIGPLLLIPLLPVVAAAIFARFAFMKKQQEMPEQRWAYWVICSAVLCGLLVAVLLTQRADFIHLAYLAPLLYLVLAWVVDGLHIRSSLWGSIMPVVMGYVLLSSTAFGLAMLSESLHAHHKVYTRRGEIRADDADHSLEYVQANVKPGERMFIYPYEPLYYYLIGTVSPTRFDFLERGMHTPEQFQESLRALMTDQTRVVLFETSVAEKLARTSPNTPLKLFSAEDPIEEYILRHYRTCAGPMQNSYWTFLFMVRKDLPCLERVTQN